MLVLLSNWLARGVTERRDVQDHFGPQETRMLSLTILFITLFNFLINIRQS